MTIKQLSDKELAVIKEISENATIDQRTIAQNTGLSLGLTNLIIKKLVKTGYVKIKQLSGRKIKYILTPKGFIEKTKKSYNYILRTTKQFLNIYNKLENLIYEQYSHKKIKFYIVATDEIYKILELVFKTLKLKNVTFVRLKELPQNLENSDSIYLVLTNKNKLQKHNSVINLAEYLI